MNLNVMKKNIFNEKEIELNDEDTRLQEELLQLVDDIIKCKSVPSALLSLKKLICISTTSMTAVPKPLKYLRNSYISLKMAFAKASSKMDIITKRRLADIISVLALAAAPVGSRECLHYCLKGTMTRPGDWGHEYMRQLEIDIIEEWCTMPLAKETEITKRLLPLVKKIIIFDTKHYAEIQACDLCLEINQLNLLKNCLDENNYTRICSYLVSSADYTEDMERRSILKAVTEYYLKFHEYSRAILVAMQLSDSDLVYECFSKCPNSLLRKQLAHILSRKKDLPYKENYSRDNSSEIESIRRNSHINKYFQILARELDILEPKTPEEIYKSWLETGIGGILEHDSARSNLAATFASAFVHAGFGVDKLMSNTDKGWPYKNKEHAMLSATASLGLIHIWDVDGGLVPIDKFLYAHNENVRAGALLAIGLVNCGVQNECEPALALLSEYVMSSSMNLRIGAILGLGLAYTGSQRKDLNDLLIQPLTDKESTMEIISLSAIALGFINVGSINIDASSAILQKLLELNPQQLSSTYSRFLPLSLGLIYMGRRDNVEPINAALDVLPNPYRLPAQTMIQVCSYAGTGDVLIVQELLRICSEPVEIENEFKKSSSHIKLSTYNCYDLRSCKKKNKIQNNKIKNEIQNKELDNEIALTQPIASLGVAVVGLSEGKENSRIFSQIARYGANTTRIAVPLSIALSYISNPDPAVLTVLNKYSHDNDSNVALNAIFALGLIGAGTNNARVASMLRQLVSYHSKNPSHLFLIRISQGLIHLGKGTMTLQPLKFSSKILDHASLAGLLVVLVSFLDCKNLILGKSHYLLYCLSLAIEPRWLITLDENLELLPVQVRIGQAMDVIGKAGDPKSITGGHVHMTPILMCHGEKAELVNNDEYEPLLNPMEGFVILRQKSI